MHGKNVYEDGMRATLEQREYHWKRVVDHYTAVVVLPPYGRLRAVPDGQFTQQIAAEALKTLTRTDFAVHPDWYRIHFTHILIGIWKTRTKTVYH